MEFCLLTLKEVAKILKISERTVRAKIADNTFCPAKRIGRQLRWKDTDLQNWIEQQESEVASYQKKQNERFLDKIQNLLTK